VSLSAADFSAYYVAVHGFAPFAWQQRLAERVATSGWPSQLDLPTGSGKTSALDIALFAMALDAARAPSERTAPRRVVLVVDRRVVVSQAKLHGDRIAKALRDAKGGVLVAVREALERLAPGADRVVHVAELRGGIARDEVWAKRPDLPLLAASTVDQVGSRLLFRGYGVGRNSASIHAGLLGQDTLLLLDEVHLSEPFRQTLEAIGAYYRSWPPTQAEANRPANRAETKPNRAETKHSLPDRWKVVEMSATPGKIAADRFGLAPPDRNNPVLAARLDASKPARLCSVKVKGDDAAARATLAAALVKETGELLTAGHRRIGVVVNRVDTAKRIAAALQGRDGVDVDLVTGRMRPWDRDRWLDDVAGLLTAEGTATGAPRVVVATQCIEAGADFDFDALVTECASLDALRQRFGRLNRQGKRPTAGAVVAIRSDHEKSSDDDPVYGSALANTWKWLSSLVSPDFGIDAMDAAVSSLDDVGRAAMRRPQVDAPVLLPAHLDLLSQTSQHPFPEPEVPVFLHGPDRGEPEVSVIWRADLTDETRPEEAAAVLTAVPPGSPEAVSVPLRAVRAWLRGAVAPVSDTEGASGEEAPETAGQPSLAYRWSRKRGGAWIGPDDVEPDDVLVVPAARGGLWMGSWDPTATAPVTDVGDPVQLLLRGWWVCRLALVKDAPVTDEPDDVLAWVADSADPAFEGRPSKVRVFRAGGQWIVRAKHRSRASDVERSTGDEDEASYNGKPCSLGRHLTDVETWARTFGVNLGLSSHLVSDVALAGRLHDLGKADPRFQALLSGGVALGTVLLAKSGTDRADRAAADRARKRSGYPSGARHELLSVAMVSEAAGLRDEAHDWDLVLHLVASHHGWCRPFPPAVEDLAPVDVTVEDAGRTYRGRSDHTLASLDSGVADRFWRLQRAYGWWGLAGLEALLRLADHRASEVEEATEDPALAGGVG
jgi:CRISPR-associated endonuclease/helicase Cas3